MTALFLAAVTFCVYTYALFPLLLHLRARRMPVEETGTPARESTGATSARSASIVIAVHNESANLPVKISSLDELDYPTGLLEVIFVSDGSTDATVTLLEQACESRRRWHLYHYQPAAGKPTALNLGVAHAQGELIVFMDARQRVSPGAVQALANRLEDDAIGAVSGELVLIDDQGREAGNAGLYWRYEKWIRDNESRLYSTTGATGALYAIRKSDFTPLARDALLDDFDTPVSLLRQGKRTILEPTARLFDRVEQDSSREFRRKARTLAGNFQSFARHAWLFDPAQNPVWWQFLSHKVFRLLVPYALLLALIASLLGDNPFLRVMLLFQVVFYALGLLGLLGLRNRIVTFILIFLQLNAAAVVGAWRALTGRTAVRWKST